jgi:hypothetical protein
VCNFAQRKTLLPEKKDKLWRGLWNTFLATFLTVLS